MCFYLRNWQVTFLLYTLGVFISEYTAKAFTEPRDYRVVFLIQSPEVPKGTFRDCKQSPRSLASQDFGSSLLQKAGVMPPITPVLHSSLLYSYRCSVYLFAAMRSAMSKKIFALLRLEDTAARLFLLPHLL